MSLSSANNLNYKETSPEFIAGERKSGGSLFIYLFILIDENVMYS
jgi:hypothetical protein